MSHLYLCMFIANKLNKSLIDEKSVYWLKNLNVQFQYLVKIFLDISEFTDRLMIK